MSESDNTRLAWVSDSDGKIVVVRVRPAEDDEESITLDGRRWVIVENPAR